MGQEGQGMSAWTEGLIEAGGTVLFLIVLAGLLAWWTAPRANRRKDSRLPAWFWRRMGI